MELIDTEIVMLPESEGGRINPLSKEAFNGNYRPHIVIGDPSQREAIVEATKDHPRTLTEKYQGVAFMSGDVKEEIPLNVKTKITMALMYYPDNEYSDVYENATFTIREASKIIGYGKVLARRREE